MYNSDFKKYLANHTRVDFSIIDELFSKKTDIFAIAYDLINIHGVDSEKLGKAWGDYLGFAYVDPNKSIVNKEYVQKIGIDFIRINKAIPLYKFGKAVTVSTAYPDNSVIQSQMAKKLGELVSFVFCFPFDIKDYLQLNNLK